MSDRKELVCIDCGSLEVPRKKKMGGPMLCEPCREKRKALRKLTNSNRSKSRDTLPDFDLAARVLGSMWNKPFLN